MPAAHLSSLFALGKVMLPSPNSSLKLINYCSATSFLYCTDIPCRIVHGLRSQIFPHCCRKDQRQSWSLSVLHPAIQRRHVERCSWYLSSILSPRLASQSNTAFLPSSFAMYATTLAFAFAFEPSTVNNTKRTLCATMLFATGAIVGWPFALALSLPFVFEELFVLSGDKVDPASRVNWMLARWRHLILAGLVSALFFVSSSVHTWKPCQCSILHQVPVVCIDSVAYGNWTIVPWNIVQYNIFGGSERGPDLYGTSPWYFYILNLLLNFNIVFVLAFASLPSLAITYHIDRKRLGLTKPGPHESSPFTVLALRLAPLYLWVAILTAQAHKEERFMFPAYPLICFNAAVTVYLLRGWLEATYLYVTKSPYKVDGFIVGLFRAAYFLLTFLMIGFKVDYFQHDHSFHHLGIGAAVRLPYPRVVALLSCAAVCLRSSRGV